MGDEGEGVVRRESRKREVNWEGAPPDLVVPLFGVSACIFLKGTRAIWGKRRVNVSEGGEGTRLARKEARKNLRLAHGKRKCRLSLNPPASDPWRADLAEASIADNIAVAICVCGRTVI